MTKKQAYSYTVLRYVHDVVSGESLNVGVVMHAPGAGFLKAQTRKTIGRLKQVFPDLDRQAFISAMQAVDRGVTALARHVAKEALFDGHATAESYARKVVPSDDSALQWSPLGTGLATDLDSAFKRLYTRYVAQYDVRSGRRRNNDDVWRPVQEKLVERGIHVPFESRTVVGAQDQIEFKKAWKNGRWHAYEPLSLDLADADNIKDKARKWRGHLAAVVEGAADVGNIDLYFLLGRPENPSLMDAYESAKKILEHAHLTKEVVDENEADLLVASIENAYYADKRG